MKNQTDLIVTIVAVLIMLIGVGVCFGTQPKAQAHTPPEKVITTPAALPAADVVMATSLPGASGGGAGGGAGLAGPRRGARMGFSPASGGGGGMETAAGGASAVGGGGPPGGAPMAMGVQGGK